MEKVKDSVCGMVKPKDKMRFQLVYEGETYYFCSDGCRQMFEAVPHGYVGKKKEPPLHQENIVYSCPMHPQIIQDKPGRCPECGMELLPEKKKKGQHEERQTFDKHVGHTLSQFVKKFWVSFILTIPVLFYSELPKKIFGWSTESLPGAKIIPLVLGSVVFFYGGWVFLEGAYRELKARLPGMMTLIALATSVAYLYSVFSVLADRGHTLFWELTTLITIMLLGHYLEMKAVQGAQGALKELSKLLPDKAEIVRDEKIDIIPLSNLKINDIVLVRPGSKVAADGVIIEGRSNLNEAMITGESKPVTKSVGQEVIAGTINGEGSLKIKVTKIGEKTFLAGVMRLIAEAQASKSRLQMLSDRAAFYLTIIAVFGGLITFFAWILASASFVFALERLVAVFVIACPHALGLAIPLVASISTTMAARNGLLVKQRLALEAARNIDVVLFDKTGTLTKGEYGVEKIIINHKSSIINQDLLKLAASIDDHSEHFVAKAIVKKAEEEKIPLLPMKNFSALAGKGVKGTINGEEIFVGGLAVLEYLKIQLPEGLKKQVAEENKNGKTTVFVLRQDKVLGALALSDIIRDESRQAVDALKKMGIKTAMITGDSEEVARFVAKELKIDQYFARVLPDQKSEKVKILQKQGLKVAMVGDGINDAPALTAADLGIAIGAGTNVAIESAGIILVKNDPRDIVKIIKLSRLTYMKMWQNLFWATGYNIVAIPLAAGILAFQGILLQPALAALFMSASTVIVATNAMLLRRKAI